jgi:predicted permease
MRFPFWWWRRYEELNEEIQGHLELAARENMESGLAPRDAQTAARYEFGSIALAEEVTRDMWGGRWFVDLLQDARYGLRMLRKSPGFTAVAVLTLALGIGANTAIFSLINAALLQNLSVKDPQQLVLFQWDDNKYPPMFDMTGWSTTYAFSYPAFDAFRAEKTTLSGIFAFVPLGYNDQNTTVGINGEPTLANGMMVTGQYFSTLGVTPLLGRGITDADENPAAPRVVVISYTYWTRRFAQDRAIIGKDVTLNGIPFTVVGVAPRDFYGASVGTEPDLWVPFDDKPNMRPWSRAIDDNNSVFTARNWLCLNIMGRLKSGVTPAQAQSALDVIFHHFVTAEWHPANPDDVPHFSLDSGSEGLPVLQERFEQPLYILMVAVGLVLLIACANVATLLLARATSRAKEISVRLAVGASRSRLIRQLLTESVLMSALGGFIGLAFANWGTKALLALISQGGNNNSKIILDAGVDLRVLFFMFVIAMLTGILFGLAPALRTSKIDISSAIKDNATNLSHGHEKHRIGQSLIVVQVAASLVLMIGAGLFVRTLVNYENNDFGFDQRNLLTFGLDPTRDGYTGSRLVTFYSQLLSRIQALPGVRGATMMLDAPFSGWKSNSEVTVEGSKAKSADRTGREAVGPNFFDTMQIPIVMGREIGASDTADSPKIAVVDETFVRTYLDGENPIGRRFSTGSKFTPDKSYEIIGVARPAELVSPSAKRAPKVYLAYAQDPKSVHQMFFEVRSQGPPATIISELRDAVHQADASLPLIGLKTQTEETSEALTLQRMFARLTTAFGLLALALATIGLYGTIAYSVTRKTHEIGIRMALGAKPTDVLGMVIRQGITLTLIGIAIGVLAALGATRLIASMIYGVTPYDLLTFLAVAAILSIVALAACYIPARRAMRVDPMIALRYE